MLDITITVHDSLPEEACALIDQGLGDANDQAAPLHEVRPLACVLRDAAGAVVGGAVGRRWGVCCELQQLWVAPSRRREGLGSALVRAFEARASEHGCTAFYLETFSFQAPALYLSLGYEIAHTHAVYPHGVVKYLMIKKLAEATA